MIGVAVAVVCDPGLGLGLGAADGEAEVAGAVSARAPAGTSSRPSRPARLKARTATLRPRFGGRATGGREFTDPRKSLQLLRPGRLLPAPSNPKKTASAGPFCPIRIRQLLSPLPGGATANLPLFSHFCHSLPASTFRGSRAGTCRGLSCATILKNQLELSRGK